jgi:hypothetical protein
MELVALLVGSATLGVSGYVAWHTTWRSGTADVRYVDHNTFPEPGTASGWQARVEVENRGDAVAVNVGVWLGLPTSGDDPPTDIALVPALTPGGCVPVLVDIPPEAADVPFHVWVGWRDRRGSHSRDRAVVVTPGERGR